MTAPDRGDHLGMRENLRAAAQACTKVMPETEQIEDFIARFPAWAAALAETQSRAANFEHMAHDPHLSVAASIRSTASILVEFATFLSPIARQLGDTFWRQAAALPERILLGFVGEYPLHIAEKYGFYVFLVMRRMALMRGTDLGLVICDASGTLLFHKPPIGFALPTLAAVFGACSAACAAPRFCPYSRAERTGF